MKRLISLILLAVFPMWASDVYYAQTPLGAANGVGSCSNAIAQSSLTWSAGTTYHACNTLTSKLTIGGSGTSGNPITIFFEPGAKYSNTHWGNGSNVITSNGHDWLIVDGGTNGLIEATNNGSSPTFGFQDDETGVDLGTCNHCIIRNLTVSNMWVKNTADAQGSGGGLHIIGSSSLITSNSIHDVDIAVGYNYPAGGTVSNGEISSNTISRSNIAISTGDTGAGATFAGLLIHNNDISDAVNWDDLATNLFHHNGVMVFVTNDNSKVTGLQIYNNYIHGDLGARETGHIFLDGEGNGSSGQYSGALIYNNLLVDSSTVNVPSNGLIISKSNGGTLPPISIYNNTLFFQSANKGRCVMNQGAAITGKNNIGQACSLSYYNPVGTIPTSDYNDFYLSGGSDKVEGANSITSNPNLDGNFLLQAGSPAIGNAVNLTSLLISSLDSDRAGAARPPVLPWDRGSNQFSASSTQTRFGSGVSAGAAIIGSAAPTGTTTIGAP